MVKYQFDRRNAYQETVGQEPIRHKYYRFY
jgi:hypothetical protein